MPAEVGVNSYVDLAGADAYFANRLHAEAWTSAQESDREAALIMATRRIDSIPGLAGRKYNERQPLAFPRIKNGVITGRWVDGKWVIGVPQEVIEATCEEALALLEMTPGDLDRQKRIHAGVVSYSVGDASESYRDRGGDRTGLASPEARRLLAPWISRARWLV